MLLEIDDLYNELSIEENPISINFAVDEYHFFLNKRGLIRKKVSASRFIVSYNTDNFGVMEGKYDGVIEYLLDGVVYSGKDDKAVDLSKGHFWDWLETLPIENEKGKSIQGMMIETLPQVVAAVIVGKQELQQIVQRIINLAEHTEPQENQNTIKRPSRQGLPKKSDKPVRTSPKAAKSSG